MRTAGLMRLVLSFAVSAGLASAAGARSPDLKRLHHENLRTLDTVEPAATAELLLDATDQSSRVWVQRAAILERSPEMMRVEGFTLRGVDDPAITGRLARIGDRLHAVLVGSGPGRVIDVSEEGVARTRALGDGILMACETVDAEPSRPLTLRAEGESVLRVYRLGLAATAGWVAAHGGSNASAFEAIVELVNDANAVFERELAARLVLAAGTESLVFGPGRRDPYSGSNVELMTQNQAVMDAALGPNGYDLGHVLTMNGGGVAILEGVCKVNLKGQGVSGNFTSATGGFGTFIHEMGHQLGARHSWNGAQGACTPETRAPDFAYEPGSGSTIMSYGGACGGDNVVLRRDEYFHGMSLLSIRNTIDNAACGEVIAVANQPAMIVQPPQSLIPARTPFELRAEATDAEGDPLTYCWEQIDLGPQRSLSGIDPGAGPIIRSYPPSASAVRSIPSLATLSTRVSVPGEILPSVARNLTFMITVRDNAAPAGLASFQFKSVQVVANAGPFAVQFPTSATTLRGAAAVRWSVANTEKAPISADRVRLLLSRDAGLTYPEVLAENVANTGLAAVALPDGPWDRCRIRVQPVGRDFFDISDFDFAIEPPSAGAEVQLVRWRLDDAFGDGNANGRADPGESYLRLTPDLLNIGAAEAELTELMLEPVTPGVVVRVAAPSPGDLVRGVLASPARPFVVSVPAWAPCGTPVGLRLRVRSTAGEWSLDSTLAVGTGNPARCVGPRRFCPGDFNADQLVDDLDFSIFAAAYDGGGSSGDIDGDTATDDTDFAAFSVAYDGLLCP
ncbi:MAG TPA: M12 family metallo-peptidase [Phycisphaerales bacterium]